MTDFATQNLVNSGFAALPSFQEGPCASKVFPSPPKVSPYNRNSAAKMAMASQTAGFRSRMFAQSATV